MKSVDMKNSESMAEDMTPGTAQCDNFLFIEELDISGYRSVVPGALECILCAASGRVCP